MPLIIRPYQAEDAVALARLFHETVQTINARDYSKAQCLAWAPKEMDLAAWHKSLAANYCLVIEQQAALLGFADLSPDGLLDRLYVHKDWQGQGLGTMLCEQLEAKCPQPMITTYASITAQGFFAKRGYALIKANQVQRQGLWLRNFLMRKFL